MKLGFARGLRFGRPNIRLVAGCGFAFGAMAASAAVDGPWLKTHQQFPSAMPGREVGKFSNGAILHIKFISQGTLSDASGWDVDGSPTSDNPKKEGYSFGGSHVQAGLQKVHVCYSITNIPSAEGLNLIQMQIQPFFHAKLGGKLSVGGGGASVTNDRMVVNCGFTIPSRWKTADFEVALGVGPFHKCAESIGGKGDLAITVNPITQTGENNETVAGVKKSKVVTSTFGDIKFELPRKAENQEWRLLAFDSDNKPIRIQAGFTDPDHPRLGDTRRTKRATCFDNPARIAKFVLEARKYEWVRVKRIHVVPQAPVASTETR